MYYYVQATVYQYQFIFIGSQIGDCLTDTFTLTSPGNRGSPVICGFNTGQHSKREHLLRI
jgi:hypothetical protein